MWTRAMYGFGCLVVAATANAREWTIAGEGAAPDGRTDCTVTFQRALDDAGRAGGGVVQVPAGNFRINGQLKIPAHVTLQGVFHAPPTAQHSGKINLEGTVLQAYSGRGKADAEPFIRMAGNNAVLAGCVIAYPEWKQTDVPPVAYPPTVFAGVADNIAVIDCCLLNAYEGLHLEGAARFLIRNVCGYPSRRGLYVDACYDIGRVENCHFWPFGVNYDPNEPFCKWVNTNGVAFEFARTDWQYVLNTFCFGYGVGYKFSASKSGACNGNFLGIGEDSCRRPVLVEQMQPYGLLITNGEFVGRWASTDSVGLEIAAAAGDGKVSLNNCSFWGPIDRCVWSRSPKAQFTATATHFFAWDYGQIGSPAIQIDAGKAIIQGNTFGQAGEHVRVGPKAASVIVMANQAPGGLVVENQAGVRTQLIGNELGPDSWDERRRSCYHIAIGMPGDEIFVRRWFGQENAGAAKDKNAHMRWSSGESMLKLPVIPGKAYEITLEIQVPEQVADPHNGLYLDSQRIVDLSGARGLAALKGRIPAGSKNEIVLWLKTRTWSPKKTIAGNQDARELGVQLQSIEMRAEGATHEPFDANSWNDPSADTRPAVP